MVWITGIIGFILGLGLAYILKIYRHQTVKELAEAMFRESQTQIQNSFSKLSGDALSKNSSDFLILAKEKLGSQSEAHTAELDKKKELISEKLEAVTKLVTSLEKDRIDKFSELTTQLKTTNKTTTDLIKTTQTLNEALSNNKSRGQWGERIAEDILRIAGFIENINYFKQKTIDGANSRPDFTFALPKDLKLNMDVKFPASNYLKYLESQNDIERNNYLSSFFRDVKLRVKEITTREYIDPEQKTLDYVLLFIPNETIYAFIHEKNQNLLEESLRDKVVFCSPLTLFAVLAVIRQAVDNFALEKTSNEILSLLGSFKKQWGEYVKKMESLGSKINAAQKEFDSLAGTRKNQLERPLNKIELLRQQKGLPVIEAEDSSAITTELIEEESL